MAMVAYRTTWVGSMASIHSMCMRSTRISRRIASCSTGMDHLLATGTSDALDPKPVVRGRAAGAAEDLQKWVPGEAMGPVARSGGIRAPAVARHQPRAAEICGQGKRGFSRCSCNRGQRRAWIIEDPADQRGWSYHIASRDLALATTRPARRRRTCGPEDREYAGRCESARSRSRRTRQSTESRTVVARTLTDGSASSPRPTNRLRPP